MSAQYPTVKILNLHMTGLTQPGALSAAHHLIALRRPAAIYTPNAEMAERAARDPSFAALLNRADLLLPDGVGITAAARLCGKRLTRMPGIDFAEALLAERSFELCFEGQRWYDLVRFGKLEEGVKKLAKYSSVATSQAQNFQPKHVIFPIPQDVIDASNGKIEQNPLWK